MLALQVAMCVHGGWASLMMNSRVVNCGSLVYNWFPIHNI